MSNAPSEVRHDIAWLQPVRWATCVVLWTLLGVLWLFPHLDISLRQVSWLGFCGNLSHRDRAGIPPPSDRAVGAAWGSLAADAVLLTGLLDITGEPSTRTTSRAHAGCLDIDRPNSSRHTSSNANAARVAEPNAVGAALRDDARLLRSELDRCQSILDGMSGRASSGLPATLEPMVPSSIARLVQDRLVDDRRQRLSVEIAPEAPSPSATGAEMVQAISSLLKNAFDASAHAYGVVLRSGVRGAMVRIEMRLRGAGMSPDAKRRVGEPFFTTKEPGHALGLGLFFVRTFAERSGGTLEFDDGGGTTAILEIPALPLEASSLT